MQDGNAQTSRYRPDAWGGSPYKELMVPSGGMCLVRKLQPMDLIGGDALEASNLLTDAISRRLAEAKAGPQDHKKPKAQQEEEEREKIAAALGKAFDRPENVDGLIDTIVLKAVVEPELVRPPKEISDRVAGVIYLDTVPFPDKMAIFNWVMKGMDDLKTFRQQTDEPMVAVETLKELSDQAE